MRNVLTRGGTRGLISGAKCDVIPPAPAPRLIIDTTTSPPPKEDISPSQCTKPNKPNLSMLAAAPIAIAGPTVLFSSMAFAATTSSTYIPPAAPGWEIWVGLAAGVIPFCIASYEFGKRILIQRRCPECKGSGLVKRGRYLRKCTNCGGMLPWLGWKAFFAANLDPGNGGPLLQPKKQTSVFYSIPPQSSVSVISNGKEEKNSSSNASSNVLVSLDSMNTTTTNTTDNNIDSPSVEEDKGIQPPR